PGTGGPKVNKRRENGKLSRVGSAPPRIGGCAYPHPDVLLLRGGQEARIRATGTAGRNRDCWSAAVDQFGGLNLVTALLLACCDPDVLPYLVGWATLGRAEPVRGFCIHNVALLAH